MTTNQRAEATATVKTCLNRGPQTGTAQHLQDRHPVPERQPLPHEPYETSWTETRGIDTTTYTETFADASEALEWLVQYKIWAYIGLLGVKESDMAQAFTSLTDAIARRQHRPAEDLAAEIDLEVKRQIPSTRKTRFLR